MLSVAKFQLTTELQPAFTQRASVLRMLHSHRNAKKSLPQISRNNVILNAMVPKVRLSDNAGQKKDQLQGSYAGCADGQRPKQGSWTSQFFFAHPPPFLLNNNNNNSMFIVCEMSEQGQGSFNLIKEAKQQSFDLNFHCPNCFAKLCTF